jgi:cell division protein ZapA
MPGLTPRSIGQEKCEAVFRPAVRPNKKRQHMPLVNVMVNARAYTIACDEGEEDHLRQLAATVDAKAREVLGSVGQVGDTRLLLMAALLLADEHHSAPEGDPQALGSKEENPDLAAQNAAADAMELAAKRVEDIAARLSAA